MSKARVLSTNILKIIACVSMFCDHMGLLIFPSVTFLRIIGRLAYPLFAFALAEGCHYTKNRLKHFLLIFGMAVIIQLVYILAMKDYSLSIFMAFSISVILIYLYDYIEKMTVKIINSEETKVKDIIIWVLVILSFLTIITGTFLFDTFTPYLAPSFGYQGVLIPVIVYIVIKLTNRKLLIGVIAMAVLIIVSAILRKEYYNLFQLLAVPLLLMYNDTRGKYNLKYFFYIFYPLHILLLYVISIIVK